MIPSIDSVFAQTLVNALLLVALAVIAYIVLWWRYDRDNNDIG